MARSPRKYYVNTGSDSTLTESTLTVASALTDCNSTATAALTVASVKIVCYEGEWWEPVLNHHLATTPSRRFHVICAQYAEHIKAQSGNLTQD